MTRREVIVKAIEGRISWIQAADILGITERHMRRLKVTYERKGFGGLRDGRSGTPRRKRIAPSTIEQLCKLKRELYEDFSVRHFHQFATEKHGIELSYTWTRLVLQAAGLAEKAPSRGKYRRHRERRPMTGMLLHLDASTHEWLPGLPKRDLVVLMDDADSRILFARFVEQEGTMSTLTALEHVLVRYGRFCALYTDRGSHFTVTKRAEEGPADLHHGQVSRALKVLGIKHILARSPQARGRSERMFGTIQGRLPQELRVAGVTTYGPEADRYLERVFVPDLNKRFTVRPEQPETAFVPLAGVDIELLLSVQEERIVGNDSTVQFKGKTLQLPKTAERPHYVRCPVLVHELIDGSLAISYQGNKLARYTRDGELIQTSKTRKKAA